MFQESRTEVRGTCEGVLNWSRRVARRGNFPLIGPLYREGGEAKLSFIMSALQFIVESEAKYVVENKGTV